MNSARRSAECSLKSVAVVSAVGAAAILAYLMWVGWHPPVRAGEYARDYSGILRASSFWPLTATMVLLVGVAALFLPPSPVAWASSGGLLLVYVADSVTGTVEGDASFWPLGVLGWALTALPAAFVVANSAAKVRDRTSHWMHK